MNDKKLLLKGTCKYYRIGSKGNRHKLVIDNPVIADHIKKKIDKSVANHDEGKGGILDVQHFMRNQEIEIRLV